MALTHFCPSCWSEIGTEPLCLVCGTHVRDLSGDSDEEKLLRALYHPEPTVPVRAATILGELRSRAAVEPLIELAATTSDLYLQEAALVALGRIGDARALPLISRLGGVHKKEVRQGKGRCRGQESVSRTGVPLFLAEMNALAKRCLRRATD